MVQANHWNVRSVGVFRNCAAIVLMAALGMPADAIGPEEEFFEREVRPLLIEKCAECHSEEESSGGLRLDSRSALIKGGDSGPAIVPGKTSQSLLIKAVRREGDLEMPPDEQLSDDQVAVLTRWVEIGAPWPESDQHVAPSFDAKQEHWAFQPIRHPEMPQVADQSWIRSPVDRFVLAKLESHGLTPSQPAERRTLIRRLYYSLTGLPPAPDEVKRFSNDGDEQAYEDLVQRLLDSPHYGEHWARHWLDVARYSDTKGYVYAREERHWVHSWTYRDWVVKALNQDMPYDRFLLLQLAADQVDDREPNDLAAMGFLTLGRRFLGVRRDIIDDRIDVVCRGTMGLTVACARCHDHKYDPIPAADYYSLYGVFDSCVERLLPLPREKSDEAFETGLAARQSKLQQRLAAEHQASSDRARARVADYLFAQSELDKYPANGFDQIFSQDDLLPAFVRQWERYLRRAKQRGDPVFTAWHAFAEIPAEFFQERAGAVSEQLRNTSDEEVHPFVRAAFSSSPNSFREVCDRYGQIFADIDDRWQAEIAQAEDNGQGVPSGFSNSNDELLRVVLFGSQAASQVPDEPIVQTETFLDTKTCEALWKLQGEVDRWIIRSEAKAPHAVVLRDRNTPVEPRIFRRGDPTKQGRNVPRRFLSLLADDSDQPFQQGSGRLELARGIIDPDNPLTARVIVNRIWAHHFGRGLVQTPSDFGTRADPPSHSKLLDWLASKFIADGWSLKELHRQIVLSSTYRQSSHGPADARVSELAIKSDPDNRLLWKQNSRRLTFEELRDSMLAASGQLDRSLGGTAQAMFKAPYPRRRSLYGLVDRQFLPATLRMFDFANPDLHTPKRNETTVPQQALFLMNHPFVLERARQLAALAKEDPDPKQRIAKMFEQTLQRQPTSAEVDEAMQLVTMAVPKDDASPPATSADWQYGFGQVDDASQRVSGFTALPHFNGQAWQGGPKWPDPKLGWVQLTASGGHPGNDLAHAAIRRWTAPEELTVSIRSNLNHEPTPGDGVRAFVVSSEHGIVVAEDIHRREVDLNTESMLVSKGEVIDFVVDIGKVLNSDQFSWKVVISPVENNSQPTSWDSVRDFPTVQIERLDGWEQVAQVLLGTNEFMFID